MKHIHIINIIRKKILLNRPLSYLLSKHCLKTYLALFYENWTGKRMNYRDPEDLNQALVKLSLQNSLNPSMREMIPLCADKYAVRDYVSSKGHRDTLNELIGVYDSVGEIDFDSLPNQFVMKMNNASARNWICADKSSAKTEWPQMKCKFAEWLHDRDFGWETGEWQYSLIKPRIVVEKYLETLGERSLIDYKFHCFYGEPNSCLVAYDRDSTEPHGGLCLDDYDMDWNRNDYILPQYHKNRRFLPKPKHWQKMVQIAKDLSSGFNYVRVDLYDVEGVIFGEMTFTPHGNVMNYYTDEYLVRTKELLCI